MSRDPPNSADRGMPLLGPFLGIPRRSDLAAIRDVESNGFSSAVNDGFLFRKTLATCSSSPRRNPSLAVSPTAPYSLSEPSAPPAWKRFDHRREKPAVAYAAGCGRYHRLKDNSVNGLLAHSGHSGGTATIKLNAGLQLEICTLPVMGYVRSSIPPLPT